MRKTASGIFFTARRQPSSLTRARGPPASIARSCRAPEHLTRLTREQDNQARQAARRVSREACIPKPSAAVVEAASALLRRSHD